MKLSELIEVLKKSGNIVGVKGIPDIHVAGLAFDSRKIKPGEIFVAISGFKEDGHRFVPAALKSGASGVCLEREISVPDNIALIRVKDSRLALAQISDFFYGHPSGNLRVFGVTGTNGKTTIVYMLESIGNSAGMRTGVISTISYRIAGKAVPADRTTPESLDLQKMFVEMKSRGCVWAAMEVSSHSLVLHRVSGVEFSAAIFTNLTRDHMDFHKNRNEYMKAKAKLFEMLGKDKTAVVNADDPASNKVMSLTKAKVLTYGFGKKADIKPENVRFSDGISFLACTPFGNTQVKIKLLGRYNVYNSLAALGAGLSQGLKPEIVSAGLSRLEPVPGRFQHIPNTKGIAVVVDYAHTPDALEKTLMTARELKPGKIISVFGCGGDRDRTKRPEMGKISSQLADYTVITTDNPRSENPEAIAEEIKAGVNSGHAFRIVLDREQAIRQAVEMAEKGDLVLLAGKGHEDYQIFSDRTIHFSDAEVAAEILSETGTKK